jgi:hypothetical protein
MCRFWRGLILDFSLDQRSGLSHGGTCVGSVEVAGMVFGFVAVAELPHISFTLCPVTIFFGSVGSFMTAGSDMQTFLCTSW